MSKEISAVVYARLSDEDVDKSDSEALSKSIQNQITLGTDYIKSQGWILYKIYVDDDYSGGDTYIERPDFNKMISDAEKRHFDVIVCKTQSRFSRNMEEIERYLHNKFEEWNIRFIGIFDYVDTAVRGTKKSRQINGLANEWFLEDLSENIRGTLRKLKEGGKYIGSSFPYGYKKDPDNKYKLIIDEPAAKIVKEIFDMFIEGFSYYKIANTLNQRGIPTPWEYKKKIYGLEIFEQGIVHKKIWSRDVIRTMVRNEVYAGVLVQSKTQTISYKNSKKRSRPKDEWIRVEDTHEPLISKEKWKFVKKRLDSRTRTEKISGTVNIFSKKVYCKECGNVFYKCRSNGYDYLRCKTMNMDKTFCGNINRISVTQLETIVLEELNKLIKTYKNNDILKNKIEIPNQIFSETQYLRNEIMRIKNSIKNKKSYFIKLYEDKLNSVINETEFLSLKYSFSGEIENLEKLLGEKQKEYDDIHLRCTELSDIDGVINKYNSITNLNRGIIDIFIESIYISQKDINSKERDVIINWLI